MSKRSHLVAFALCQAALMIYLYALPTVAKRAADFSHLWTGGHLVASGRADALYEPPPQREILAELAPDGSAWRPRNDELGAFFYPPPTALYYAAFGSLHYEWAGIAQGVLNLGLALWIAWALARLDPTGRIDAKWMLAAILYSPPFFYCFGLGQNGVLTTALLTAAALLAARGRAGASGFALGALAFKPTWLLATIWEPLFARRWRALGGATASVAVLVALALLVLGSAPFLAYLELAPRLAGLETFAEYPLLKQHGLFALLRTALGIGAAANLLVSALAAVVILLSAWSLARGPADPLWRLGVVGTAAVVVNPHVHHYDLLPALLGLAALWALRTPESQRRISLLAFFWGLSFAVVGRLPFSLPALVHFAIWWWLISGQVALSKVFSSVFEIARVRGG